MVLCRLELTLLNMSFPTMVAMVGKTRAPHRILVADTWSASGLASAGIRGTGQPIPADTQRESAIVNALLFLPTSPWQRRHSEAYARTWEDAVEDLQLV